MNTTETHETYVSLEVARLLKEAGFNWGVYSYYCMDEHAEYYKKLCFYSHGSAPGHNDCNSFYGNRTISAPTLEVAQRWLREAKKLCITIQPIFAKTKEGLTIIIGFSSLIFHINGKIKPAVVDYNGPYEATQEEAIKKALELILGEGK